MTIERFNNHLFRAGNVENLGKLLYLFFDKTLTTRGQNNVFSLNGLNLSPLI